VLKTKNRILLLIVIVFFLIIYPYTKEIKIFRAKDANWDILNHSKKYKEFDPRTFALTQTYEFNDEVLSLDGEQISVKGFIKKHKHGDHSDILLTETVTDVCFMCNHDEHYNMIMLKPEIPNSELNNIEDDTFISVKGIFKLNKEKNAHSVYVLQNVELENIFDEIHMINKFNTK